MRPHQAPRLPAPCVARARDAAINRTLNHMAAFTYRAYSSLGDVEEGQIQAKTREDAEEELWRRGLTPLETRETSGRAEAGGGRVALFGGKRLKPQQLASFTREFATLEQADVPLDQSLRLLSTQNATPALRDLAKEILRHIVDGASLSESLTRQQGVFAADYINVVRAGESMGNVGQSLGDLAEMLERRLEVRARIQSSLVYPVLLIVLAIFSTGVVLGTLVPNIAPIFSDNGKPMPAGLQFIIDAESNWPIIIGALIALGLGVFLFFRYAAERPALRTQIDHFYLRLPAVGPWLSQHETARFTRTLGSMTRAGVPLLQGLESARAVVVNRHISGEIDTAIETVRSGGSLSAALAKADGVPLVATQMIAIGEEVGKLDDMLLRVATMFERQTQRSVERVVGLMTPILTIFIAAVVGGLIMTVMDAVLGINDLASK